MNWKIIVGILLIFAGIKEFLAVLRDAPTSMPPGNPIYGELGCLTLIGVGFFLFYKGRQARKLK
jgi:hypothetical protein